MGKADINSVARRSEDEFVFCAAGGRLVSWAATRPPVAQKLATKAALLGIAFASPNEGYVVGEGGVAFTFDGAAWKDISTGLPKLFDVHCFQGRVFTSEADGLYALDATGKLEKVHPLGGRNFASNGRICATYADDTVTVFDGEAWRSLRPFAG